MFRKIIVLSGIVLFSSFAFGQFGIKGGYEYAYYHRPFYNLQIAAYNFNKLNTGVTNDLKVSRMPHGMFLGFVCGPKGMVELTWHNFHAADEGKYTNGGVDTVAILKHRLNYSSIAINLPFSDKGLGGGFSMDFAHFKVFKKKASASGLDSSKFVNFYSNYGDAFGVSLFLNYSFVVTNGISLNVRPFYHWFWRAETESRSIRQFLQVSYRANQMRFYIGYTNSCQFIINLFLSRLFLLQIP